MKVIGIDAGGSKTRVLSGCSEDFLRGAAERLDEVILGPGNFRQLGTEGIRGLAREIVARHRIEAVASVLIVGGFAGAGTPQSHRDIEVILAAEGFRTENVTVTSDAGLLLEALGGSGIVLIAGTGSICMGRTGPAAVDPADETRTTGRAGGSDRDAPRTEVRAGAPNNNAAEAPPTEARAGGYGYRLPSEPGGYFLGIRALDAALKIEDGRRHPPTALFGRVREYLGLDSLRQIVPTLYPEASRGGSVQEKVAGLAGTVMEEAAAGDAVAAAIVDEAVSAFADHIRAVHEKLSKSGPTRPQVVGLHGGLFVDPHADELLIGPLEDHPHVAGRGLSFETLGVRAGDPDPLMEVRSVLRARSQGGS